MQRAEGTPGHRGVPSQEAAAGVAAGSSMAPEENPLAFLSKSCFQSQLEM